MSSRLEIVDHRLKLRTHLLVSSGNVVAAVDYDAVSVFTVAQFDVTLRGRIETDGAVHSIALSPLTSYLFSLAIFDDSYCMKLFRIRLRSVDNAAMIVNCFGSFRLDHAPTCLLISPEICLVCADRAFVITNGSIKDLNMPARTAAITTGYFAIASLDEVTLFQGNRIQWSNSCSSVASLLFASLSLIVGHDNGSISVYNISGKLQSRILACDSIQRLIGPVKHQLQSSTTHEILRSLPLELFNHETFPSDHVVIVQTRTGIMLWPYYAGNDGEIRCPTLRDLLNCESSYDFTETVVDLCLISSDAVFTLLIASEHDVVARRFISNNADSGNSEVGEMIHSEAGRECSDRDEFQKDLDHVRPEGNIITVTKSKIMDFLPKEPRYDMHPIVSSKTSTVLEEVLTLRREFRDANREILELRSSLSAFSEAMTQSITEIFESLNDSE